MAQGVPRARGRPLRSVLVLQKFLDIDHLEAVRLTNDLMTSRMKQFQHVLAEDVPLLIRDLGLSEGQQKTLATYFRSREDWMVGILEWHGITRRYQEPFLRAHSPAPATLLARLSGPTGLGTAGARLRPPTRLS